jgi:trimeric autotransporter adhesin
VLSGPTTYTGTASSDVMDNTINYPVTFNVSNVAINSNFTITNAPAGTYQIAVTDACGWTDTSYFTVNPSDLISRSLSTTLVAGCLDAHTVSETVTRSSCGIAGVSNAEYNSSHLVNAATGAVVAINTTSASGTRYTNTYNNVPSGTYYLRYNGNSISILSRNGNNSSFTYYQDTIEVVYTQPSVSGVLAAPCPNSTVGSLIATVKDGSGPFTYEILDSFPNNTVIRAAQSFNTFTGLPLNTKYRVRIVDNCGNSAVSSNISFAGIPNNVAASTNITCAATGSSVTLTADTLNATTYAWTGPSSFTATGRIVTIPSFTTAKAGTYKVVSTTVGNCLDSATVVVNQKPNAGTDFTVCKNNTATLSATLFTTGSWSSLAGNPSTATITTPNNATTTITSLSVVGTYNFIWTASTGCSDTVAVTVNALPTIAAITGTTSLCVGKTTQLADATASGVWSSVTTSNATINATGLVTGVAAGTSIVRYTVTGANGCKDSVNTTVTVNALPVMASITGSTNICLGKTSQLVDATAGGTWKSVNTSVATISATGVVTSVSVGTSIIRYTVTNVSGCVDSVSTTVTVNALPVIASITGTTSVCVGQTTTLADATASGVWKSVSTGVATINATGVVTGVAAGTSVIRYTVTNANGCVDSVSTTVTVNALPTIAAITGTTSVCVGKTTTLADATASGVWKSVSTGVATISATGVVTGVSAGTSIIRYTVTNASGCVDSVSSTVTVNALPVIAAITGTTSVCIGQTTQLADATASGVWKSVSTGVATISATGLVTGVTAGTSVIRYTVTNANGCVDSVATTVTVNALPNAGADKTVVCYLTDVATMSAVGTGTWSAAAGNPGTATIATAASATTSISGFSVAGTYKFVWTSAAGCTDTANVVVGSSCSCPIAADSIITINSTQCAPYSGTINGSTATPASVTYQWQVSLNGGAFANATGTSTSEDYAAANLAAGTYQFRRVANYVGTPSCTHITDTVTIVVNAKPSAGADITNVCSGQNFSITGTPTTGTWSWNTSNNPVGGSIISQSNGVANVYLERNYPATYSFIYTATSGCKDTMTISEIQRPWAGNDKFYECGTQPVSDTLRGTDPTNGGTWSALSTNAAGITLGSTTSGAAAISLPAAPATGTWSFIYTAPNGCTDTVKVSIGVNGVPSLVVNMGNNPICFNGIKMV